MTDESAGATGDAAGMKGWRIYDPMPIEQTQMQGACFATARGCGIIRLEFLGEIEL